MVRRLIFDRGETREPDAVETTSYAHVWLSGGMVQVVRRDRGYEVEIGILVHKYGVFSFGCTAVAMTKDTALDIAEARMRELCPAAWLFYAPGVIDTTTTNDATATTTTEVTP